MDKVFQLSDGKFTLNKGYWVNYTAIETETKEHTHGFVELVYSRQRFELSTLCICEKTHLF